MDKFWYSLPGLTFKDVQFMSADEKRKVLKQWEALDDEQAEQLILSANELLDMDAFEDVKLHEQDIAERLRRKLEGGDKHG